MKQTSIEWLEEKLKISFGVELTSLRGFFVQAKEMHKQEMASNCSQPVTDNHVLEISHKEIIEAAIKHSNLYVNKFTPRNAFYEGAIWFKEQLKNK